MKSTLLLLTFLLAFKANANYDVIIQVYDNKINGNIINNIYELCMNQHIAWSQHGSNSYSEKETSFFIYRLLKTNSKKFF